MEEINEYMKREYSETLANVLERVIKFEFPLIKKLKVYPLTTGSDTIRISFEGEEYSREEVMRTVDFYRQKTRKIKEL